MLEDHNCPNCGAPLSLFPSFNRAVCSYCNTNFRYHSEASSNHIQSSVSDNPVAITFEREETEKLDIGNSWEYLTPQQMRRPYSHGDENYDFAIETYTGKRQSGENELEARLISLLSTITGMSFLLKKNYTVQLSSLYYTTYEEKDIKKARKQLKRRNDILGLQELVRSIEDMEKRRLRYLACGRMASSYGFIACETKVIDVPGRKLGAYTTPTSVYELPGKKTTTDYALDITPQYFEQQFPTIATAYGRIKNREEVRLMAERLTDLLIAENSRVPEGVSWMIRDHFLERCIHLESYLGSKRVGFNEFGMGTTPNYDTALAIRIAVLGLLIATTSAETGEYAWDLEYSGCLRLKPVIKQVAHYNSWL